MSMSPLSPGRLLGVVGLLVAATFAVFAPALGADFQTGWDDNYMVTENGYFRGLSGEHLTWMFTSFRLGHWQPLSWISLAIDYKIWGLDPFGYHLTNLVLHAGNAVLFFFLCRALLRAAGSAAAEQIAPSLIAALLFAIHPLRVESVVWITERRDVLSTFFLLLTVLAWLRYTAGAGGRFYALALAAFAISLLAKAWGITLWVVFITLDVWPLGRLKRSTATSVLVEKIPFILLAMGAAAAAFLAQQDSGAMHYAEHFTWLQKGAQACYGLCFYLVKSVWPAGLCPAYLLDRELDPGGSIYIAGFVGAGFGAVGLGALLYLRRAPAVVVAALVYVILVAPVLGLTQSGVQLVADRYTYLATMPFAILVAGGLGRLAAPELRKALQFALLAALALFGLHTFGYSKTWKNSTTLWEYTLTLEPRHALALNQLGTAHRQAGRDREALEHYERAVEANPKSHLAYENRGIMRMNFGDEQSALEDFETALALNAYCPIPIVNRGSFKMLDGDYAGARIDFERALELRDDQPIVWYNLASSRSRLGDQMGAVAAVERCLDMAAKDSPLYEEALKLRSGLPR